MNKYYLFLGLFLLLAASASAFTGGHPGDTEGSNITGKVVNTSDAKPMKEVTVIVSSPCLAKPQTVRTDVQGNFNFVQLEPCVYKLTFQTDGYKKITKEKILVVSDKETHIKVTMEPDDIWLESDHGLFSRQLQIYD